MGYEKINATVAVASNIYGAATGYGNQVTYLLDRMKRHKMDVAMLANYGLEGRFDKIKTRYGTIPAYPRGFTQHSHDVMPLWYEHFTAQHEGKPSALFTLYDVWVFNQMKFDDPIISWVPLDHVALPPEVARFLQRDNVTPVTMSPHGQRQLESADIKSTYIPHSVDMNVFKPTFEIEGQPTRSFMGISDDTFLVTMVSANKANGVVHRKGLYEGLAGFALFLQEKPDSHLYLHMEASNAYGGFVLPRMFKSLGIPPEKVTVADSNTLRIGYPQEVLAAIYTASDILLMPSYGEGFGIPSIEMQACGGRVLTGSWSAMPDLAGPSSFLISGQPFWDETQAAPYYIPYISQIVEGLKLAYGAPRGVDEESIEFVKQFEVETVWRDKWLPFFQEYFNA